MRSASSGSRTRRIGSAVSLALWLLILTVPWSVTPSDAAADQVIHWQPWSDDVFRKAQQNHKLVLLDLEAVWCHWCHVMDRETYDDPAVIKLINEHYIALKVDQDLRPDLSNRYEEYGWPATIMYAADGTELVKRSGYIPSVGMAALLQAVVEDPTPGPSIEAPVTPVFSAHSLSADLRAELVQAYADEYDPEHGAWGIVQKYLDRDSAEYALSLAQRGDPVAAGHARQSLDAQRRLIDPVWGGVYQYSTGGDWGEPHFEKIMAVQAANLRVYSMAALQDPLPADRDRDLASARAIDQYLSDFLTSSDGAFYTSQDADRVPGVHSAGYFALDDHERRKLGLPRIDHHRYSRENGWAIEALAIFFAADRRGDSLVRAQRAARWVLLHRALPGGGFRHDEMDRAGPYLGDTLAMGRAFLALYVTSGDRTWLKHALEASRFISERFTSSGEAGYTTAESSRSSPTIAPVNYQPLPLRSENAELARFANRLFYFTGDPALRSMALRAQRFLIADSVARRFPVATVLLVDQELATEPLHVTVIGSKSNPDAGALFDVAVGWSTGYTRIDWWDRDEGPLPNADVEYPVLTRPAAFFCTAKRCSTPVFDPQVLQARLVKASAE